MKWSEWREKLQTSDEYDFDPDILRLQQEHPSPLPRAVLWGVLALLLCLLLWALFGRLDIIAEAHGKLVPQSAVKIVQAADSGIVKELLVHEGDRVVEGQIVARMDPVYSEADGRTIESELHLKGLQLRRIDAEMAGEEMLKVESDPAELFAQVQAQYRAHRQAYLDALASAEATRSKTDQDLKSALEIEQKLKRTLPSYRQQSEAFAKLVEKGYVSKLVADEKQRELIEREQDLRAQQHSVKSLLATIIQAENQVAQISSSYREELQNERVATESDYHRLKQESEKQIHRHGLLEIRAPQSGTVKDISTRTPGTVVSSGTVLMTVVPMDDPLEAEVWVSHIDAGFVRAGQSARVKVSAYSFQKYGMLEGEVDKISPDAIDNEEAMRSGTQGYRAVIALGSNELESHTGKRYALTPGMQVSAEIHLGSRSVIEYLLSPVQKASFEAGRER